MKVVVILPEGGKEIFDGENLGFDVSREDVLTVQEIGPDRESEYIGEDGTTRTFTTRDHKTVAYFGKGKWNYVRKVEK